MGVKITFQSLIKPFIFSLIIQKVAFYLLTLRFSLLHKLIYIILVQNLICNVIYYNTNKK